MVLDKNEEVHYNPIDITMATLKISSLVSIPVTHQHVCITVVDVR